MKHATREEKKLFLKAIRKKKILVLGDIILDHYIWGDTERISPEAPVPVIEVSRDTYTAGGAANVGLNVQSLGGKAEILGWVGLDEGGSTLKSILSQSDVELDKSCFNPLLPTIVKTRIIVKTQQLCRLDRENPPIDYAYIDQNDAYWDSKLEGVSGIILSDYAKGFITQELIDRVVRLARQRNIFLAIDPKPKNPIYYKHFDLMTPNRMESFELAGLDHHRYSGSYPAELICQSIWDEYQPEHLVITLGSDGMLLSERGKVTNIIPTYSRQVYDVSGAGDTVVASLTLGLIAGLGIEQAADFANTAAGIVVSKVGTATATPDEILHYHEYVTT